MKGNNENKQKNKLSMKKINIIVMSVLLVGVAAFLAFSERPKISEAEKRELTAFPEFSVKSLFNGEFASGLKLWYDDTVPQRDKLNEFGSSILECTGIRVGDIKIYGELTKYEDDTVESEKQKESEPETEKKTNPVESESDSTGETSDETESVTEKQTELQTETKIEKEDLPDEGDDGMITNNILVYKKRAINLYGGSLSNAERYSSYVNAYKKDLGDSVNVYSMTIPTAVAFYLPDKYQSYTRDQKSDMDYMAKMYSGVEYADVYSVLEKHKKEDIYLRTDHHWQPLGAYYAAEAFCKQLGVPFSDLSTYEKVVVEGYVGSMYAYTNNDAVLLKNPDTFVYYKPNNNYECWYYGLDLSAPAKGKLFFKTSVNGSYCAFLGTDKTVAQIRSENKNGRKLMIIKDSYGNALVPFLTGSFEEVWVIDMRYFERNTIKFIKNYGITDVLFASCMFSACGGNAKYIEYLRTLEEPQEVACILSESFDCEDKFKTA